MYNKTDLECLGKIEERVAPLQTHPFTYFLYSKEPSLPQKIYHLKQLSYPVQKDGSF